jgi:uncharacterized protein (UPF0264 family)
MKLLISVTATAEIESALQGGADIVDVKNPAEGALGAAPPAVLHGLADLLWPDRLASAALGESDSSVGVLALAGYGAARLGVRYVKLGLRLGDPDQAINLLRTVQTGVHLANPECGLIAVGYADAARIGAISWQSLPEIADQARVEGCMIDTAFKDGHRLLDYCNKPDLERWLAECRQRGLLAALAGSLSLADLPAIARLRPDVVGFRGAACAGDRVNGRVTVELVAALRAGLAV